MVCSGETRTALYKADQEVNPFVHSLACFAAEFKDSDPRLDLPEISKALASVPVKCGDEIGFGDHCHRRGRENGRILKGFIFAFGGGQQNDLHGLAEVVGRGANKVADVFDEEQFDALFEDRRQGFPDSFRVKVARAASFDLPHMGSSALQTTRVAVGLYVAGNDRAAYPTT